MLLLSVLNAAFGLCQAFLNNYVNSVVIAQSPILGADKIGYIAAVVPAVAAVASPLLAQLSRCSGSPLPAVLLGGLCDLFFAGPILLLVFEGADLPATLGTWQGILPAVAALGVAQRFAIGAQPVPQWWRLYQSDALDALVDEGLRNSPTLAATDKLLASAHEQLRAQIAESQARLKGNEAQLSYTRLYAPIAGTVLGVDVKQGQTLNATYQTPTVLRIADLSAMTAWTKVSEADIRQLKPGLGLYFTTLGGDGRRWHAKIRQILPSPPLPPAASGEAGAAPVAMKAVQYTVLFDVDNQDGELMPQMTAQVTFVTAAARDVLTAPLEALQAVEGKSGVFTARILNGKGRPEAREVRIGARSRQRVEVLDGLQENEQLITAELPDTRVARFQW